MNFNEKLFKKMLVSSFKECLSGNADIYRLDYERLEKLAETTNNEAKSIANDFAKSLVTFDNPNEGC